VLRRLDALLGNSNPAFWFCHIDSEPKEKQLTNCRVELWVIKVCRCWECGAGSDRSPCYDRRIETEGMRMSGASVGCWSVCWHALARVQPLGVPMPASMSPFVHDHELQLTTALRGAHGVLYVQILQLDG
jgi:hypothetical protein